MRTTIRWHIVEVSRICAVPFDGSAIATVSCRNPIRVLVVDDHPVILWGLARLIEGEPRMQVVGLAACGHDAVRLARETRPDVIVLDVELEGANGLDLLPTLVEASNARVLVLSAGLDPGMRECALRRGACKQLSKDEPGASILSAIESACRDNGG